MPDRTPDDDANDSPAEDPPEDAEDRASRVIRTFRNEPTLWPVALVVFLSVSSFGALVLVYAIRMRGLMAGIALIVLIFLTVYHLDPDIRARRLRPASAVLLAIWGGSAAVAFALTSMGAF